MLRGSLLTVCVALALCRSGVEGSVLGWIWGKNADESTVLVADGVPLISIPYESMTEDEKFLQEAAKFTDIQAASPLETCQHKVIMKIRTSCSEMTEEELAKLSVNLLNCQSAVEGRKMFPCTEEMSLKQCTTDMDPDMWNAYHLMSNRARAVCYTARSTQFRALTELTVNKLMQTAHTQIRTLGALKDSQDRLEEQTVDALSTLSKGNEALLKQQAHLKDAQASAHNLVTTNLRELNIEKALIRSGHTELAAMASDIRNKLEEANRNLEVQAARRGENHDEIIRDLMDIQEQARQIWEKIEISTNRIFAQHEEALHQYEQTLQKLGQINDTIQYIWDVTNTMRAEVDDKLSWLTNYIGDTGEQMQRIYRAGLHVIYLLLAMVVAAFLHAPLLTRITILGIVPLNLASFLKHGMDACLDFVSMSVLILIITLSTYLRGVRLLLAKVPPKEEKEYCSTESRYSVHFLMVGIQRAFGPKSAGIRAEPIQVIHQNGPANGRVDSYDGPSRPNLQASVESTVSYYGKLRGAIGEWYTSTRRQINRWIHACHATLLSTAAWGRSTLSQREQLSCSYVPSRRNREDLHHDYEREFPSMSEDITDYDHLRRMDEGAEGDERDERDESYDNFDYLLDANDLRLRLQRGDSSVAGSSYSRPQTPNSSVSTSHAAPRVLCNATTKKGRRCNFMALRGQPFCSRHSRSDSTISSSKEYL